MSGEKQGYSGTCSEQTEKVVRGMAGMSRGMSRNMEWSGSDRKR
jgi:hypothetical protein